MTFIHLNYAIALEAAEWRTRETAAKYEFYQTLEAVCKEHFWGENW